MLKGIIYKYESPSNKVYIGQTVNEHRRRNEFLNINDKYGGEKIYNARLKYGPSNFKYEVLFENTYSSVKEANKELNEKEVYFIKLYNSVEKGYNISTGGDSIRAVMNDESCKKRMINSLKEYYKTHTNPFKDKKHTEENRRILSEKAIGRPSSNAGKRIGDDVKERLANRLKEYYKTHTNPFKGKKHSKEALERAQKTRKNFVVKININTNEIIEIFDSLTKASMSCGVKTPDIIKKVCENYVSPSTGRVYDSAYGYKWKYIPKDKGSTTNEKLSIIDRTE